MYWLAFGTYHSNAHPRVAALIAGIRAHGHELVELNEPLDLSTADRVQLLRQPWRLPRLAYHVLSRWSRLIHRAAHRAGPAPDAVLVGYLGHFDVLLARRLFPHSHIVLDHLVSAAGTATDRGVTGGLRQRLLRALDVLALGNADVVVVDTEPHRDQLPPPRAGGHRSTVVVPVGATEEWFGAARSAGADRGYGRLRVIFFGLFTPLQGAAVIAEAAAKLAGDTRIEFTFVGRGQDHDRARALARDANATWIDWVPSRELPALVAAHDVCLGIFGETAKGRSVVPTKVFQGAAAGCAIVTSDTPPQRAALADAARYVPPGDCAALATALVELATDRCELSRLRHSAAQRADQQFTAPAVVAGLCHTVDAVLPANLDHPCPATRKPRFP